jgi:hypothetical protein
MITRLLLTGIAFAALSAWPAGSAYAAEREHGRSEIKLLKDSAKALAPINADLSTRLKQYAAKESGETEAAESEKTEANESSEIQLLKESASALEGSRPDLAKRLKKYADKEARERKKESSEDDSRGTREAQPQETAPSSGY